MRIAGSLWSVPPERQASALANAASSGLAVAHWDVSDGEFAGPGGFTAETALPLLDGLAIESEAHLMMKNPNPAIAAWASFCSTIVVPLEIEGVNRAIDRISALGARPAIAVSLETSLHLVPADLPVLLMSIVPGTAGSPFDPAALPRVRELRARGRNALIGVDGGAGPAQFSDLAAAGANWLVSGTSLFSSADPREWLSRCEAAFVAG